MVRKSFSVGFQCNQKGGVHRTHNTSVVAQEPCRLNSADLLYSRNSKPSHTTTTDQLFPPHLTDRRCTDTTTRSTSSVLLLSHRSHRHQTKNFPFAFTKYVQSRKHRLSGLQKTHKTTASMLFQGSFLLSLILLQQQQTFD